MSTLIDWRSWAFQTLRADAALAALLPQQADGDPYVFGAGAIEEPPAKRPFVSLIMGDEVPGPFAGVSRARLAVHAHDEPGDYLRLGSVLAAVRSALAPDLGTRASAVRVPGGVACIWQGDSGDLANPDLGTIFRISTYDLQGRDG